MKKTCHFLWHWPEQIGLFIRPNRMAAPMSQCFYHDQDDENTTDWPGLIIGLIIGSAQAY